MYDLLAENCADDVRDTVWTQLLEETLKTRESQAQSFLNKIMRTYRDHPINHNHYYTDTIQKIRHNREKRRLRQEMSYLSPPEDSEDVKFNNTHTFAKTGALERVSDMGRFSCEEALDCMRAIYKVRKHETLADLVLTCVGEAEGLRGQCAVSCR